MDLLNDLNPEQKKAITHDNGPLLIVAGAGTGKTTVITRKIAYLIMEKKVTPENILALTFTEKAAEEMEERIETLLPFGYFNLWVSTFHSFAEKILKEHALDIGLPNNFKLLSEAEQWLLIRHNLDEFDLDYYQPKGNPTRFIEALVKHFSRLKDEDITPQDYLAYAKNIKLDKDASEQELESETKRINELASAYHTYQKILLRNNSMDFGDLITYTIKIFKERPRLLKKYCEQFKYILVDEFQDTNYAQYDLIKMLTKKHNNLTVVGDDDQSIYKFRGASVSNILAFKKDYPQCQEVVLTDNYRSGQNILDLAHNFIKLNDPDRLEAKLKIKKTLISHAKEDSELEHLHFTSREDEAVGIVKKILELKNSNNSWNDFAILIRANNQANLFTPYLERADIPYQFLASAGLFSKPLILDLLAYMRLLDNYHESRAMYRVLNIPVFKMDQEEIFSLLNYAKKKTVSLYEAMRLNPSAKNNVILALVEKHTNLTKNKGAGEVLLQFLEDSGYLKYLTKKDDQMAKENSLYLNQLYKYIIKFDEAVSDKSIKNFIEQINMMEEAGEQGNLKPDFNEGPETLKILTVHSAKGLEFKYVFLVNMVDKRFPSVERPDAIPLPETLIKEALPEGDAHLQEERRLFYVAITRAKDGLFLTSAEDYGGARKKKLSRFIIESGLAKEKKAIPTGQVKFIQQKKAGFKTKKKKILSDWSNHKFSFTQLTAFENCPWQYRFAHILKIPVPGKSSFSFGKTIHSTLYEFFRRMKENNEIVQADLFGKTKQNKTIKKKMVPLEELLEIYEDHWIDEWYFSKKNKEEYYKKGKEVLKNFYAIHENNWPKTKYLEQSFVLKINDYSIKGAIDRIDEIENGLEIIDYKTGQFPKTKKEFKQLILYALAVKDTLKQEAKRITYYYIEDNKQADYEIKKDDYDSVKSWIISIINDIKKGDFTATPGHHCQYCDYSSICEYRK